MTLCRDPHGRERVRQELGQQCGSRSDRIELDERGQQRRGGLGRHAAAQAPDHALTIGFERGDQERTPARDDHAWVLVEQGLPRGDQAALPHLDQVPGRRGDDRVIRALHASNLRQHQLGGTRRGLGVAACCRLGRTLALCGSRSLALRGRSDPDS